MSLFWLIPMWFLTLGEDACLEKFTYRAPHSARYYYHIFDPVFVGVGKRRNIDPALLKSIAWCETRLDPCAQSPAGAQGIMQFMPKTFESVSLAAQAKDPFDPLDSIESAGIFVSALINYWRGDLHAVVSSYNAGPKTVLVARKQGQRVPQILETQNYVQCVLGSFQQLRKADFKTSGSSFSSFDFNLSHIFRSLIK